MMMMVMIIVLVMMMIMVMIIQIIILFFPQISMNAKQETMGGFVLITALTWLVVTDVNVLLDTNLPLINTHALVCH
jgi:hypothetical protein